MIATFRRLAYLGSLLRPSVPSPILGSFRVVFGASIAFWAFSTAAALEIADVVNAQEIESVLRMSRSRVKSREVRYKPTRFL